MSKFATEAEVAEWLRVHPKTLAKWRRAGAGPPHTLPGRSPRYLWAEVYTWAAKRRQGASSGR